MPEHSPSSDPSVALPDEVRAAETTAPEDSPAIVAAAGKDPEGGSVEPTEHAERADHGEPADHAERAAHANHAEVEGPAPIPPTAAPIPELSPAACAARLAELFPAVFTPGSPKPLKLRIQVDVQQRAPGLFTRRVLSGFLQRYTTATAYLKALANATERADLDGAPAGAVSDEHRQAAAEELARRRTLHDARRAAERDAQRQAQRDAYRASQEEALRLHAARAADEVGRRDRAVLLRAFETTTLTRANFCALKRMPELELDAMLAQARAERAERPPAPPQPRADHRQVEGRPPPSERDARGRDLRERDRRTGGPKPLPRRPPAATKPTP